MDTHGQRGRVNFSTDDERTLPEKRCETGVNTIFLGCVQKDYRKRKQNVIHMAPEWPDELSLFSFNPPDTLL